MRYTISARYGELDSVHHTPHTGIDFVMPKGTQIHSVHSGIVHVRNYGDVNAGKTILIDDNHHTYIYGHLSSFKVHEGEYVNEGDLIGLSGNTGNSTGSHLHFGIRDGSHYVDPSSYIPNIEHMNDKVQIASDHSTNFMNVIHQQVSIYSDLLHNIKINFINLIHSIDYSVFVQQFQDFIDLFF